MKNGAAFGDFGGEQLSGLRIGLLLEALELMVESLKNPLGLFELAPRLLVQHLDLCSGRLRGRG